MLIGGAEGPLTEIKFEKCKAGLTLYSVHARSVEPEEDLRQPLSPLTKTTEMHVLTEIVSSMAGMRMDDQRCVLKKDQGQYEPRKENKTESKLELIDTIQTIQVRKLIKRRRDYFIFGEPPLITKLDFNFNLSF